MSGFEDMASPDVYKRWAAFGLLSTHSRLHGSSSYRVPWLFGEESVDVVRHFTRLKCRLMPYLFSAAVQAHTDGIPAMRAMVLAFDGDRACEDLDRQYMLGDSLLVAPIFRADGVAEYYLPVGTWTHLLSGEVVQGGAWREDAYDFFSLPLFVRENSLVAMGASETEAAYDFLTGLTVHAYQLRQDAPAETVVYDEKGDKSLRITATRDAQGVSFALDGPHADLRIVLHGMDGLTNAEGSALSREGGDIILTVEDGAASVRCR